MLDQAQGLREFLADSLAYATYKGKLDRGGRIDKEVHIFHSDSPVAEALRKAGVNVIIDRPLDLTPDKAKLWDDLKAELESELNHGDTRQILKRDGTSGGFTTTESAKRARAMLDRMNQAEIFATHVRPASPQDFASVRDQLKGENHA